MNKSAPVTAGHFSLLRILMGIYLIIHFLHLLPYGAELFSAEGLLPAALSPLMGIIPNPLATHDAPWVVTALLLAGAGASLLVTVGAYSRIAGLFIAVLLGWLFARNPLIANPSLPVVGWMLLAHACLPGGAYGSWKARHKPELWQNWYFPRAIWIAAWIMLAVAYSYSGYTKLLSPSWIDGSAIGLVLENPLARDHFAREWLLALPVVFLQLLTWGVLLIELLFIPLCFVSVTRKWAWLAMLFIQFGFLTFLNFADLTFPMLLIHLLTFDRRWLESWQPRGNSVLFFDGSCAFCSGLVRFGLVEDVNQKLEFSPLQGQTFNAREITACDADSIAVVTADGTTLYKSDAVAHCLEQLGGLWLILGKLLKLPPRKLRDQAYDWVGRIRYRLAGRVALDSCRLLPAPFNARILP